jgi:antirestriction protein ArdC
MSIATATVPADVYTRVTERIIADIEQASGR